MADREIRRSAHIGTSLLIVVFIVLCLATFGLLSLGSARSDLELAERNVAAVQEYYRADSLGTSFYLAVDQAIADAAAEHSGKSAAKEAAIAGMSEYYDAEADVFCTNIPMESGLGLRIELQPHWEHGTCRVKTWKVYHEEDYEIDQGMQVWNGGLSQ